jgi:hypothetical protein
LKGDVVVLLVSCPLKQVEEPSGTISKSSWLDTDAEEGKVEKELFDRVEYIPNGRLQRVTKYNMKSNSMVSSTEYFATSDLRLNLI